MAPLPKYRVTPRQPVFSSVAVDYAGPYEVRRNRTIEKRWLCIFACNATSAIRIEVVESLETTAFLNAFRRFLCLSGMKTRHIRCDCATTFVGARNMKDELKLALRKFESSTELKGWLKSMELTWEFSTSASSHHQGFIERQIRTFRSVTEGVLGPGSRKRTPTDFELLTIFREAEYAMNCLPLGKYLQDEDPIQPLCPIDLITGYTVPCNHGSSTYQSEPGDELRRGYCYTQKLAEAWWERWVSTYLPLLQKRQKWTRSECNLKEGDVVLLMDDTTPLRGKYPYALVIATKPCKDGRVRSATVRTSDGLIRDRDIRKLVLIESTATDTTLITECGDDPSSIVNQLDDDKLI